MNCLRTCEDDVISYRAARSAAGEHASPDLTRRGFIVSIVSGLVTVPILRLSDALGLNWNPRLIRPPGALAEGDFLNRCIKCGQCMRICPTNIIQPAGPELGVEALWTPTLNFRIGTSGCQTNCVACGNICPTAAIRPITLDEKAGQNAFAARGPIRLGTAFVDQGRCLPWAMGTPCIVCQENCPVSPKAIFTREVFNTVRTNVSLALKGADRGRLLLAADAIDTGRFGTGDYHALLPTGLRLRIIANTRDALELERQLTAPESPAPGSAVVVQVRLQQPYVDPKLCIGCGVCEHECPVLGRRAIRVAAENESRHPHHRMVL